MTKTRGGLPVLSSDEAMRYLATPWNYAIVTGPHGVAVVNIGTDDDAWYLAYLSDEAEVEWLIEGWIKVSAGYDQTKPEPVYATQLALDEAARRYPGFLPPQT
jgi:hypothetical protein